MSRNENLILTGSDPEQIQLSPGAGKIVADVNYRYCIRNTNREWQYCLRVLQNRWRFAALFGAAIFTAIAIVTYSITPVYEATARLEIEPPGLETFSLTTDSSGTRDPFYTDTQAELLKVEALATLVIRKLRLDREPIFVGKRISKQADSNISGKVELTHAESIALKYFQEHLTISFVRKSRVLERMRYPMSKLGPGLGPWLYSNAPMLFCYLPRQLRIARVRKALGPAGAWWLRDRVVGRLPIMLGYFVRGAEPRGENVLLHLQGSDGQFRQLTTDHVIAATGYRFTLGSLPFLSENLLSQLRSLQRTPVLSANFESSVPGLYFTGLASAYQFGPAMRFLHGAEYTARCVSSHIADGKCRLGSRLSVEPSRVPECEGF